MLLLSLNFSGTKPEIVSQKSDTTFFMPEDLLPDFGACTQVVDHNFYSLCYLEKYEQSAWVFYRLTKEMCELNALKRNDKFLTDPFVKTGSAENFDYKNSGYDRGHLCPAGDMNWSEKSMTETFYMSNMSPQLHAFNAGIWAKLEAKARKWAVTNDEIYIVAGGILKEGLKTIGVKNKIAVPEYFYKIILDNKEPRIKAIAFIMPNAASKKSIFSFAVPVDSVEKITGIDFFPGLSDSLQNSLESKCDTVIWKK